MRTVVLCGYVTTLGCLLAGPSLITCSCFVLCAICVIAQEVFTPDDDEEES